MLTLLKLWVTVAILDSRCLYFFAFSDSLAFGWGRIIISRYGELGVDEILVVLGRKFDANRRAYCL